jgi:aspartyl-tRNA(Asn)/glutamyl-tRNA(Gln) amidotransferase subunit B
MEWEVVIGLEVHVQLATKTKIFSGAATKFGAAPNTQACAIDLGMPGVLPVFNGDALHKAVAFGLAIDAEIGKRSVFDRKNYFYPDLPKGYQITQMDHPIVGMGHVDINLDDGTVKRVNVTRAHLEEDAGKSLHEEFEGMTGVDLNRAGTPLLEVVSEPELSNAKEAVAYLKKIHSIITYLEISDGNMAEGSMRCDANVSIRRPGDPVLGTRCEIKNVNSFRFVEKAINYEILRHIEILEDGGKIVQETRLYDAEKDETRSMRSKEVANDYRYFPEPDLLPVIIDHDFIEQIAATMPELPDAKSARFITQYGLSDYDANVLAANKTLAQYFEDVVATSQDAKLSSNWVMGDLSALLNKNNLETAQSPISAQDLGTLILRIKDNTISGRMAKTVFEGMWDGEGAPDDIIAAKGLKQVTDNSAIEKIVDDVIAANPEQVAEYRSGKDKLFGFFVGQAMKLSRGQASPGQVNDILKQKLQGE